MCGDIFERILLFSVESLLNISLLNIIIKYHGIHGQQYIKSIIKSSICDNQIRYYCVSFINICEPAFKFTVNDTSIPKKSKTFQGIY